MPERKNYTVIAGRGARRDFVEGLARELGAHIAEVVFKEFPDGELYVRIEGDVEGEPILVQSMYPRQNDRLVELLLLVEAVRGLGAPSPIVVIPYLAYARQDKRFLKGEPISLNTVLKSIEAIGGGLLVVVDAHSPRALDVYRPGYLNVVPSKSISEKLRSIVGERESSSIIVVAPDKGALDRAERVARHLSAGFDYLVKKRDRVTGEVVYLPKTVRVENKTVILVDDIISTGGTMAKAARILYSLGAVEVIAACSHGLFVGGALQKMRDAGIEKIVAANTVPLPRGVLEVDISREVAGAVLGLER